MVGDGALLKAGAVCSLWFEAGGRYYLIPTGTHRMYRYRTYHSSSAAAYDDNNRIHRDFSEKGEKRKEATDN